MEFSIRTAQKADVPIIVEGWKELMRANLRYDPVAFATKRNAAATYRKFLLKKMKSRNARVFVAEFGGKTVGYLIAGVEKLPPVYVIDREAYVLEIFVKRAFRGNGIGTKLLAAACAWGRKRGLRQLGLTVNIKNARARKVYANFGLKDLTLKMTTRLPR